MKMTPRHFFDGRAAAIGGRIYRPVQFDIEVEGASALSAAGGISRARIPARDYGQQFPNQGIDIGFDGADTFATGGFANQEEAVALTNRQRLACELETVATSRAEIGGIRVGLKGFPRFEVARLVSELVTGSPDSRYEPSIRLSRATTIEGVSIGGFGLRVVLNRDFFHDWDSGSKLMEACQDPGFVEQQGLSLRGVELASEEQLEDNDGVVHTRRCPARVGSAGYLYATIVKELEWADAKPDFARIDRHTVTVKDFGRIYFGEILISSAAKQLTMFRLELGSPMGGLMASGSVGQSGGWVP